MLTANVLANSASGWQPANAAERIEPIDIIRGLALFGVLMVNILGDFRLPLLEHMLRHFAGLHGLDLVIEILAASTLEFKAFTIFSFLFGVGIAIQFERASSRNVSAHYFLAKRLGWLFVLGAIHLFLIWNGDILTLYAICGLLLLPLVGLSWPILLLIGAALIALPEIVWFGINVPSGSAVNSMIAQTREVYGSGGYFSILRFRWRETWSFIIPILIAVLPRTVGLMYCGVAAWRSGILLSPQRQRPKFVMCLLVTAAIGGLITANDVAASVSGHAPWPGLRHTHIDASILLAMSYLSALLIWLTPQRAARMRGLAALGRTALTNYLVQSIVLGFIFYGYGFRLFGRIGPPGAAGIGVAIYLTQIYISRFWLRRFRFGPFEWLWRCLSYGSRQPMRSRPGLSLRSTTQEVAI